jgi:membrane-bound serine protease (ClpP class)
MTTLLILLVIGAALLFVETLLPGGIAGVAGSLCLLAAIGFGYREFGQTGGTIVLAAVFSGWLVGVWAWLKYFPDSRFARPLISQSTVGELGGDQPDLLHATGLAASQLRPSGVALINGQRLDVVTEGALIDKDTPIRVILVEGSRIVVREVT